MHAFINPVNKNLQVLMAVSPAQSSHLYVKEMKGSSSGKIVSLEDSVTNRAVFNALCCIVRQR